MIVDEFSTPARICAGFPSRTNRIRGLLFLSRSHCSAGAGSGCIPFENHSFSAYMLRRSDEIRSSTTCARSYMSLRASPVVHVSSPRVVSVTSAATSMSRMTNATSSSINVMPRRESRCAIRDSILSVFMVQGLCGPIVLDLDLFDFRVSLPGLGVPHLRGVERARFVLHVEADVELARLVLVARLLHLDVRPRGDRLDQHDVVVHVRGVPELALPVDPGERVDHDILVRCGNLL